MATSDIHTARQRKTKLQAWVSRICASARECLATNKTAVELTGVYNNLKSKYENYRRSCEHVIDVIEDDEELNVTLDDMTMYDNELERLLAQLAARKTSVSEPLYSPSSMSGQSASATGSNTTMKLPKLELRPFNGETTAWPEFWDLFHVAVHANSQVPIVQKFAHLKSLLWGEAAKFIASIPTTAVNYDVAIDRLQSRYGKPELL